MWGVGGGGVSVRGGVERWCACVWSRVLCEGQYTNLVWREIGHAAKQSFEKTVYQIIMLFPKADLQRCTV